MQSISAGAGASQVFGKVYRKLARRTDRFGILYNNLEARLFDFRYGTDTAGKTPFHELDVEGDSVPLGTGYQAVNAWHFNAVLRTLSIPRASGFVDIGCGKGKPLLLASRDPRFATITGVEMSSNLCEAARRNVTRYGESFPSAARIEVVTADASRYDIPEYVNVVYVNNPFEAPLVSQLLDNVIRSLDAAPRPLWLLYYNPASAGLVERNGRFRPIADHRFFGPGRNVRVYTAGPA